MVPTKLFLDTDIVIDYLDEREPHYEAARLLMIAGRVGEVSLWLTSSQMADLIYILSDGGKRTLMPPVLERLRGLRTFVNIYAVGDCEVDSMLATSWNDPEDALLFDAALHTKADYIVTRNKGDFESTLVKTANCRGFFDQMRDEHDIGYDEIEI